MFSSTQMYDMNTVLRRNLVDLQQAMLLERGMFLSNATPKFDSNAPRLDIQTLLANDLAMRLRASQAACNGAFAQHCGPPMPIDGGPPRGDSGSSSPSSSCNTNRPSQSSNGGHRSASGSHCSGRSSQSPSDTPSSSHTCPDRGGSSPVAQSPPSTAAADSEHHSAARSENRSAARRAPAAAARPSPAAKCDGAGGGGGDAPEGTGRKRSWKILLTAELAAEIYSQRPRRGESTGVFTWILQEHL
jgi:hypothetical protein